MQTQLREGLTVQIQLREGLTVQTQHRDGLTVQIHPCWQPGAGDQQVSPPGQALLSSCLIAAHIRERRFAPGW